MLMLDEFQTWFDGLTNTERYPWRHWAYNFIQILSEIAKEHPELLVLVISGRNGGSDAYQQVHRVNPSAGSTSRREEAPEKIQRIAAGCCCIGCSKTRLQIATGPIETLISAHISEYSGYSKRLRRTGPEAQ